MMAETFAQDLHQVGNVVEGAAFAGLKRGVTTGLVRSTGLAE
jgi:hypothetical protein